MVNHFHNICNQSSIPSNKSFSSLVNLPRAIVIVILLFNYFNHFRTPHRILFPRYIIVLQSMYGRFFISPNTPSTSIPICFEDQNSSFRRRLTTKRFRNRFFCTGVKILSIKSLLHWGEITQASADVNNPGLNAYLPFSATLE